MTKHFKSSNGRRFAVACGAVMLTAFLWSGAAMALTVDASALAERGLEAREGAAQTEITPCGCVQRVGYEIEPNGLAQEDVGSADPGSMRPGTDSMSRPMEN